MRIAVWHNLPSGGAKRALWHHVQGLVGRKEAVSFAWLCDVDPAQIDRMAVHLKGFQTSPAKRTSRFEDVIEDSHVDAVIIATPHHWHAPIAIRAMQNGKDVYIEKPISHTFDEGPLVALRNAHEDPASSPATHEFGAVSVARRHRVVARRRGRADGQDRAHVEAVHDASLPWSTQLWTTPPLG